MFFRMSGRWDYAAFTRPACFAARIPASHDNSGLQYRGKSRKIADMTRLVRVLVLILSAVLLMPAQAGERVVRIANGEWPPYSGENLAYYGLASRIVTEAFKREGVTVHYGFFPWRRAYLLAMTSGWDGTAVWSRNDERAQHFYYSDPVVESDTVFFHLKTTRFSWNSIDDLSGYVVGVTNGYYYHPALDSAIKAGKVHVQVGASDEQNLRKLLAGRIDVFPIERLVAMALLRAHFTPEEAARLTFNSKRVNVEQLHLLLGKQRPENRELIDEFNKGLKKLRDEGRIDLFMKETLGADWHPGNPREPARALSP